MSEDSTDYPALFRILIFRSVEISLQNLDLSEQKLTEDDRERCLYALSLALNLDEGPAAVRELALAIAPQMETQGYRQEWMAFLDLAIAQAAAAQDLQAQAALLVQIGRLHQLLGEYQRAEAHFDRAIQIADECSARVVQKRAWIRLADGKVRQGDLRTACEFVARAMELIAPNELDEAYCESILGLAAMHQGDWSEAIAHYQRCLAISEQHQALRDIGQSLRNLGHAYARVKNYAEALDQLRRGIEILHQVGSVADEAMTYLNLGIVYWYLNEHNEALACYNQCEATFLKLNDALSLAHLNNNRGLALRDLGRYAEALACFRESERLARSLDHHLETANVLESLGGLYQRLGQFEAARSTWQAAVDELAKLSPVPQHLNNVLHKRLAELVSVEAAAAPPPQS